MILIKTSASRIYKGDGVTLMQGTLVVTPNVPFEYTESTSPTKRKVSLEPIQVPITDGQINSFNIAPTTGASQDKTHLYYIARFYSDSDGADFTEYWTIDAAATELEITEIAQVVIDISDVTDPTVTSDEVSVTPTASFILRANGSGKIAVGWLPSLTSGYAVSYYQSNEPSPAPGVSDVAFWFDTSVNQIKVWDGTTWRTFA